MKIISLEANNIKRLSAVNITPEGNVIQITGKNGEGKSSVLDSIVMALAGGNAIPAEPIHKGADKGDITLDLGDLVVKRRFTQKGNYLSVETADGAKYGSPQKILDELIGRLAFDPMEFMRMKEKDQFETLAQYTGVDLESIDNEYKDLYDHRTAFNRVVKSRKQQLDDAVMPEGDVPDEEINAGKLLSRIEEAIETNRLIDSHADLVNRSSEKLKTMAETIAQKERELERLRTEYEEAQDTFKEMERKLEKDVKARVDVAALKDELASIGEVNAKVQDKKNYLSAEAGYNAALADVDEINKQIDALKEKRQKLIASAKMPVEGLGLGVGFVTYNDLPLAQASSAEQIRVTVAIAMAMNPKLRVIRVQDGSLLDSTSMEIIAEMAQDNDYQFWVERVDESGKIGIMIEDGQVAAIEGKPQSILKGESPLEAGAYDNLVVKPADQHSAEEIEQLEAKGSEPAEINLVKESTTKSDAGQLMREVEDEALLNAMSGDDKEEEKPTEKMAPQQF